MNLDLDHLHNVAESRDTIQPGRYRSGTTLCFA